MALYGGIQGPVPGKKMLAAEFTPTSITTTINTEMSKVDSVIMTFVSIPTATHNHNHYTASTNGTVRITHLFAFASTSAASTPADINYSTATASWSRLSYIIVGSEQPPAAS